MRKYIGKKSSVKKRKREGYFETNCDKKRYNETSLCPPGGFFCWLDGAIVLEIYDRVVKMMSDAGVLYIRLLWRGSVEN